jgi:hypothetical protein
LLDFFGTFYASNDPQNRDENVDYYIAKLDEIARKIRLDDSCCRAGNAKAVAVSSGKLRRLRILCRRVILEVWRRD